MNAKPVLVHENELTAFARDCFMGAGVSEPHARRWAEVLVWANLRGVDSHGVLRIPGYVDALQLGTFNPRPNMEMTRQGGAIALLDADAAPGPVGMCAAMEEAIRRARDVHIGWCAVRDVTHTGAVGYYALLAAEAGMAGIVMTGSQPMMAYAGARIAGVSTNPLAIAVPGADHRPLMLDMSTATVSNGKILRAKDTGEPIPDGWGIDAKGLSTNDAKQVKALMPMGGAKGAGLSVMIECLTSILVGFPLIAPALTVGKHPRRPINGACIAIDIAAFGEVADYRDHVDDLAARLVGLPRAEGVERIFAPGERGDAVLEARRAEGIPLPQGTWTRLAEIAERLDVPLPVTQAGGG